MTDLSSMHMLVLIGSDNKRATVSRAIATEASYVLRDLLDAEDILVPRKDAPDPSTTQVLSALPIADQHGKQQQQPSTEVDIPDLMDFNAIDSKASVTASAAATSPLGDRAYTKVANTSSVISHPRCQSQAGEVTHVSHSTHARVVELPFPCLTGDILERVCYHMSYRFRISTFGVEDNFCRVYPVKTRELPKPLTLPFNEYLDSDDRRFVADWDENITVWMVKAALLLNYEELLQLASAKLASYLCEKNVDGLRTLLRVESDFTALEEADMKKELQANEPSRAS